MVTRRNNVSLVPLIIFFIVLNAFFISGRNFVEKYGFDQSVLIIGNLILFGATLLSFFFAKRGLTSSNTQAFVRSVYLSIMVKLFVCIIAALIYIFMFRENLNRPALFTCMGLYLIYTLIEVSILTKMLKEKKNAQERSAH
jgi:predicted membrane channel-forming protein YqfA (hemolysin III family)